MKRGEKQKNEIEINRETKNSEVKNVYSKSSTSRDNLSHRIEG